LAALVAEGRWD